MSYKDLWLEFYEDALRIGLPEERAGVVANIATKNHLESKRSIEQMEMDDLIEQQHEEWMNRKLQERGQQL